MCCSPIVHATGIVFELKMKLKRVVMLSQQQDIWIGPKQCEMYTTEQTLLENMPSGKIKAPSFLHALYHPI